MRPSRPLPVPRPRQALGRLWAHTGRPIPLRWAGLLVALALVAGLALPTLAQQWVGAGHRMPKAPPDWAIAPATPKPGCIYFPETQHNLCGGFRQYWETYGGLLEFGYPLTEEYFAPELGHPGHDGVVTQWFERARFEWHPGEVPQRFDVLQGHLGREILAMLTAPTPTPTPTPTATPTPAPSAYAISLTPSSDTNPVGTTHTVTAVVTVNGQPTPNVLVRFVVTGGKPLPADGIGYTGGNGATSFSFTDTEAGTDTILAWIDFDNDGVRDTNEPRAVATKTWTAGPAASLDAEPESQTLVVENEASITVEVTDTYGNPVANTRIRATVSGANPTTTAIDCGSTNSSGQATCEYSGDVDGTDTVRVWADLDNDGTHDTSELYDDVTVTWQAISISGPTSVRQGSTNRQISITAGNPESSTISGARFEVTVDGPSNCSGTDEQWFDLTAATTQVLKPTPSTINHDSDEVDAFENSFSCSLGGDLTGQWGPSGGFTMDRHYLATTTFTFSVNPSAPTGTYRITVELRDGSSTYGTATFTVQVTS